MVKMPRNEPQRQDRSAPPGLHKVTLEGGAGRPGTSSPRPRTWHEVKRFAFAGAINTLIGASLIYLLQAMTSNPYLANTLGYLIAGVWAYFLHAKFTFKAKTSKRSFVFFALISASGYALNILILHQGLHFVGPFYAQTAAIVSYAAYSYLMQSSLAFRSHARSTETGDAADSSATL